MAKIKPFKGIRPVRDKAHLIPSRPYYTYSKNVLEAKLQDNPYTYLHIITPEFGQDFKSSPNTHERFKKVRNSYEGFIDKGWFLQENKAAFYLYRQSNEDNVFTGIIAGASIDDYFNNVIKKHEQTITERELVFKEYLNICGFNAEPVLLTYANNNYIQEIIDKYDTTRAEYEFTTTDANKHELWVIDNEQDIENITKEFEGMDSIYIADGHHRCASSGLLGLDKRKEKGDFTGNENFNYMMAIFMQEKDLKIFDFNRVVKSLNNLSPSEFISKVEQSFEVTKIDKDLYKPQNIHELGMYLEGNWYKLTPIAGTYDENHPVENLDSNILSANILSPILDIHDLKTDNRVSFVGGLEGVQKLKSLVDKGKGKVAFALFPVPMEQLKLVSDTDNIMPPKSTWIEPKLRSGLTIYSLENEH